jgi:hypothetical protein
MATPADTAEMEESRVKEVLALAPSLFPGLGSYHVRHISGCFGTHRVAGDWTVSEGNGLQFLRTWWTSPRASLQYSYCAIANSSRFFHGGSLHELTLFPELRLGREWPVQLLGQLERWRFPLLFQKSFCHTPTSAQLALPPTSGDDDGSCDS